MIMDRKLHNNHKDILNYKCHILKYGSFGIKSITGGRLTELKLNILLRLLNKNLKFMSRKSNSIKFWNLVFMNSTLTSLSKESRMGKGKGAVYTKFCYIKPGQIIFEFSGISLYQIKLIHNFLRNKCPFRVKIINI
uniref:Ribosomal protein L16 n=1 Tax=Sheathia arcuata TaxID=340433 RepID=A0A343UY23_9FLOR|nr:ribosomal protein L16 [Sheathia arcuata]